MSVRRARQGEEKDRDHYNLSQFGISHIGSTEKKEEKRKKRKEGKKKWKGNNEKSQADICR